jgi:hypothetical protein
LDSFVNKVDVTMPTAALPCAQAYEGSTAENPFAATFLYDGAPVGPLVVPPPNGGPIINFTPGQPMPMIVWLTQ